MFGLFGNRLLFQPPEDIQRGRGSDGKEGELFSRYMNISMMDFCQSNQILSPEEIAWKEQMVEKDNIGFAFAPSTSLGSDFQSSFGNSFGNWGPSQNEFTSEWGSNSSTSFSFGSSGFDQGFGSTSTFGEDSWAHQSFQSISESRGGGTFGFDFGQSTEQSNNDFSFGSTESIVKVPDDRETRNPFMFDLPEQTVNSLRDNPTTLHPMILEMGCKNLEEENQRLNSLVKLHQDSISRLERKLEDGRIRFGSQLNEARKQIEQKIELVEKEFLQEKEDLQTKNSQTILMCQQLSDEKKDVLNQNLELKDQISILKGKDSDALLFGWKQDVKEIIESGNFHNSFLSFGTTEIQQEIRFLNELCLDISSQVMKVIQSGKNTDSVLESCLLKREELRKSLSITLEMMNEQIKTEKERISKVSIVLMFENKLDSEKWNDFMRKRAYLDEVSNTVDLFQKVLPKKSGFECLEKKISEFMGQEQLLEQEDEDLDKMEATVKLEFKKNTSQYKSHMKRLEEPRQDHIRKKLKLLQHKNDLMENDCSDYPELKLKLIGIVSEEDSLVCWLKSICMYQDCCMDYFKSTASVTKGIILAENLDGEKKILKMVPLGDEKEIRNEIELLRSFAHPYIIKPEFVFLGDHNDVCIQFPFYETTLKKWIQNKSIAELKIFYLKLLHTLSYIHEKRVIHRDIKFDNILVTKDGNPIIIDFGIGKKDLFQQTGTIGIGTPYFMAPELEKNHATFSSDVWSFGVMLYDTFYGLEKFGFQNRQSIEFPPLKLDTDGLIVSLLQSVLKFHSSERSTFKDLLLDPFFYSNEENNIVKSKNLMKKEEKISFVLKSIPKVYQTNCMNISLNRKNVIETMIQTFSSLQGESLRKNTYVSFENEFVVDVGGPTVEMFVLFFTQLFVRENLFKFYETQVCVISGDGDEENLIIYETIGKIMLKALLHRIPIPLFFSTFVYRYLLEDDIDLQSYSHLKCEVSELDPFFLSSLAKLSEQDDLSYYEFQGKELIKQFLPLYKIEELKKKLIPNLLSQKRLDALKKGFRAIDLKTLRDKLTPSELQEVLCGSAVHNAQDLWNQFKIDKYDWTDDKKTIDFFKKLVFDVTTMEYRAILKWMTGLVSLPIQGLSKKISILPRDRFYAHTCISVLSFELKGGYTKYDNFKIDFMNCLLVSAGGEFQEL